MSQDIDEKPENGIVLRVARGVYKNVDKMNVKELENLIAMMIREILGLHILQSEGTIPLSELDFYVKPIESRIKLVEGLIENRKAQDAIDVIGNIINP